MATKKKTVSRRSFLRTLGAGVAVGTASAMYVDDSADWLSLEKRTLKLPNWDAEGFRVAVVSDLHLNGPKETVRAKRAVQMALEQRPNLVLIPGDFLNVVYPHTIENISSVLSLFSDFGTPCAAVMGNHDYFSKSPSQIIERVSRSPVKLLRNEVFECEGVTVAGVDDAIVKRERFDFFHEGQVSKSIIGMLHEPDFVVGMPKFVSLQISGHSHGGQVCLPTGVPLFTPYGARNYVAGFYPNADVPLYVTRGVGTTGLSYRLFCRPEVTLLTLRSA